MKLRCRIFGHKWGDAQEVTMLMEIESIMMSRKVRLELGRPYQQCQRCPHKRLLKWED